VDGQSQTDQVKKMIGSKYESNSHHNTHQTAAEMIRSLGTYQTDLVHSLMNVHGKSAT